MRLEHFRSKCKPPKPLPSVAALPGVCELGANSEPRPEEAVYVISETIAPRRFLNWLLAALFVLAGSSVLRAQAGIFEAGTTGASGPTSITGPDQNGIELFTERGTNSIGFFSGSFTFGSVLAEYPICTTLPCPTGQVNNQPMGIALGPQADPTAWFTEYATNQIGEIIYSDGDGIPQPTFQAYPIPTLNSLPYGITLGPDGALWFTEFGGNKIGRIAQVLVGEVLTVVITEYPIPTAGSGPQGITVGSDNGLWFTEFNAGKIGRIDPTTFAITEYVVPTVNSGPSSIAAGPDGALWFTEFSGNKIGSITTAGTIAEFVVPTSNSGPAGITAVNEDGNLWFTENSGNKIGRITSTFYVGVGAVAPGWFSEYSVPTAASQPLGISGNLIDEGAVNLFFTEYAGDKIGLLTPYNNPVYPGGCVLGPGEVGVVYTATCNAAATTGGAAPYTWTATGLPPGLSIDAATGAITGTPTTAAAYTITITLTDSTEGVPQTAYQLFAVNVYPTLTLTCVAAAPGEVGVLYSSTPCTVAGGDPPISLSATGLPPGLAINAATGAITGTPTTAGPYNVTVTAGDSLTPTAQTATKPVVLTIYPKLLLTCVAGATGVVGATYSSTPCAASGGDAPIFFSAAGLPPGLAINTATGAITGTPTTAGPYNVTVTVTDSLTPTPQMASQPVAITIYTKLILTCAAGVEGVVGTPYSSTPCTANDGDSPYAYAATGLPPGLTINAATGAITGTPTTAGPYSVTVTASDSLTPTHQTASQAIAITIVPKLILNCSLGGQLLVGNSFSAVCTAIGGVTPYSWSAGGLPPGLSISSSTGQITGAPTASGSYTVTVTVVDSTTPTHQTASQQFTLVVISRITLSCGAVAPGTVGTSYSALPCSVGGGTPPYSFSASGLPTGLSISPSSGTISGTPTVAGTFAATVSVNDSAANPQGGSQGITIVINAPMLNLSCASAPQGMVGTVYTTSCSASGGTPPYAYGGSGLPPGLSANPTTGAITGTPTTAGPYSGTITVTDSSTPAKQSASRPITIVINPARLSVTCGSAAPGIVGTGYSAAPCSASGGNPPYAWIGSGLPPGLSANPTTGAITGTPTTAGPYSGTIMVTDSTTPTKQSASQPIAIVINLAQLSLSCASAPQGIIGASYSAAPCSASGGNPPYAWIGSGLPPGLSANPTTGAITGTPTTAGPYSGTITVTDSSTPTKQSASQPIAIAINPIPLNVTCVIAPQGIVGTSYSAAPCSASGGNPPYAWIGSGLPPGLSANPTTGAITGTPTTAGPYSGTLTVTDSSPTKQTQSPSFTISILPGVAITGLNLAQSTTTNPPQSNVTITLANPSADPVTALFCMTFQANSSVDQPPTGINPYDASFANANSSLLTQCPPGSISAISFTLGPSDPVTKTLATISQGTVAGEITLTIVSLLDGSTSVLPGQNTSVSVTIPAATPQVTSGPVISSVANGSFTVSLNGYTNTREFTEADFTFTPGTTGGTTLNNSSSPVTITVLTNGADQTQWFQTPASAGLGGAFSLTVSFPYSGDASALGTVTVTLKNNQSN
jgi:streptogramin lyase